MLEFIFAVAGVVIFMGLIFSPLAPELTIGYFFKDKTYHNNGFAVLFYFGILVIYTVINLVVSAII